MENIGPILGYLIRPIWAMFQDSQKLEENIVELERTAKRLDARRKDAQGKLEESKNKEEVEASAEATLWFSEADKVVSKADNLKAEYDQKGPRSNCFCWSRYQLSQKAWKLKQDVEKLYKDEPRSWTMAHPTSQKGRKLDTISIEGQKTTEKLKREIINGVLDNRYVAVGLHGMGGVGKTTLLQHANNHFMETDHFEFVIFITVSARPNFVEMRKKIARSLCLDLKKDQDEDELKENLSRLLERRKYLLILDDLWQPITDLDKICFRKPTKENGCKILMASRLLSVVTRFVTSFGAKDYLQSIRVSKLSKDEAWMLFVQKVGEAIISKPAIEPLAKAVVKKFDGLPLAIAVFGGTMSTRETEGEWRDVLHALEDAASNLEGREKRILEKEVLSKLIFSFENLEPVEQRLFLYCCLFREDCIISKEELFKFAIGEETLCDEMSQLGEIRDTVDSLVGQLLNSSMLEKGEYHQTFKMHNVMRILGLWITSPISDHKYQDPSKFIVKVRAGITEAPHVSKWPQATKISLMENEIESLPQLQNLCPQLHTLLLNKCFRIKEVPRVQFMEHIPGLRILDLSGTSVRNLPPSISLLCSLRLLCLSWCRDLLELPPEIGMLVQLIRLDLFRCESLRKLPVEMKMLKNLRSLDISYTENLKTRIPPGVLSGLRKLEELYTSESGLFFNINGEKELSQLIRLRTSVSTIPMAEFTKVEVSDWLKPLTKGMLFLCLWNCTIDPSALPNLLEDSPNFYRKVVIKSCEGLTRVPTQGCAWLTIQDCPNLKTLLMGEEAKKNISAFQSLYKLKLDRLDHLETICSEVPQNQSQWFTNLKEIRIQECPNLEVLFSNGVTGLLTKLEYLYVYGCCQLVKLVSEEDLKINAFPSLKEMVLYDLPELRAICDLDLNWPSLHKAYVCLCPKLKRHPLGPQCAQLLLNDERNCKMIKDYLDEDIQKERERDDDGYDEKEGARKRH